MKNDAVRFMEVIEKVNSLLMKHGNIRWEYGPSFTSGPKESGPSETEVKSKMREMLYGSLVGGGSSPHILNCCLLCEFEDFDQRKGSPFWTELWESLSQYADVEAIKAQVRAEVAKTQSSCVPYAGSNFLKIVAEHLIPAIEAQGQNTGERSVVNEFVDLIRNARGEV